jgi:mRNA interferase MazF
MKQRDIYLANLNPTKGSEQQGTRPVVVISGNAMNQNLEVAIVCPLTTAAKGYAGCVKIMPNERNNLETTSDIITFQIRTISKERLIRKIGEITNSELTEAKKKLIEVLTY